MAQVMVEVLPHGEGLPLPTYASEGAAGADVCAAVEEELVIPPGGRVAVPTGLRFAVPLGFELQIRPRSGLALKHGVSLANSPGTVDADYRGEVKVIVVNLGTEPFIVHRGDRIAQLVLAPVRRATFVLGQELPATARGEGGFGSTGV